MIGCLATLCVGGSARADELIFNKQWNERSGYFDWSPGLGTMVFAPTLTPFYMWGVAVGRHLPLNERAVAEFGAAFEHGITRTSGSNRRIVQLFRITPELRFGGIGKRLYGYGLMRFGLEVAAVRFAHDNEKGGTSGVSPGIMGALGAGARILIVPRFSLGAEAAVVLSSFAIPVLQLRLLLGWRF